MEVAEEILGGSSGARFHKIARFLSGSYRSKSGVEGGEEMLRNFSIEEEEEEGASWDTVRNTQGFKFSFTPYLED